MALKLRFLVSSTTPVLCPDSERTASSQTLPVDLSDAALDSATSSNMDALYQDLKADIPWSTASRNLSDVEQAYNAARATENSQLGVFLKNIDFPDSTTWSGMNSGQKALWIVNQERTARGMIPLDGLETNVTEVAAAYAKWLLTNNQFSHTADGKDPKTRIHTKPAIAACHDFLAVSENLGWIGTTQSGGVPYALEHMVYTLIYDDEASNWGHRRMILYPTFTDNSGQPGREGFLGIGHVRGPFRPPNGTITYTNTDLLVMNVFDPCPTWVAKPAPTIAPPPPPKPVATPIPKPNTASVSGQTMLPSLVVVEYQPFERDTWPGKWFSSDSNGKTNGEYKWIPASCRVYAGEFSGMAVGGGVDGMPTGCNDAYPNNARSWMIAGPFSFADAVSAELSVKAWVNTEPYNDIFCLLASLDKKEFNGPCVSGNSGGWVDEKLDLNDVYKFGTLLGQPKVYLGLAFVTNDSVTRAGQGVFADTVWLVKGVAANAGAAADDASVLPLFGVHITDEAGHTTMTDCAGNFSLPNLSRGIHTLTPTKEGYQFYPPHVTVDLLKGSVSGVSFTGSTSVYNKVFLPSLHAGRYTASSSGVQHSSSEMTVTEHSFRLDCGDDGCSLVGPLE